MLEQGRIVERGQHGDCCAAAASMRRCGRGNRRPPRRANARRRINRPYKPEGRRIARICKVLIVENDDQVRNCLAMSSTTKVTCSRWRRAARRCAEKLDEDDLRIAVIDVTQPGHEDGFALAQIARDRGCGPILVTGDHRYLERLQAGGGHFLLKPFRSPAAGRDHRQGLDRDAAQCVRRKRGRSDLPVLSGPAVRSGARTGPESRGLSLGREGYAARHLQRTLANEPRRMARRVLHPPKSTCNQNNKTREVYNAEARPFNPERAKFPRCGNRFQLGFLGLAARLFPIPKRVYQALFNLSFGSLDLYWRARPAAAAVDASETRRPIAAGSAEG